MKSPCFTAYTGLIDYEIEKSSSSNKEASLKELQRMQTTITRIIEKFKDLRQYKIVRISVRNVNESKRCFSMRPLAKSS